MQDAGNGEFYPERNFNRNYKIPRRNDSASNYKSPGQLGTPLTNSYYNYQHDANYVQYAGYPQQFNMNKFNYSMPPPPPPPPEVDEVVEQTTRNIFNTLNEIKEKPKNVNRNIFQQTVPDLLDQSLPKDLKILFQPLFCKLCSVQLSSNQVARMHYKSKNHEKKIRQWLVLWSERTGEPIPQRATSSSGKKSERDVDSNPAWYHCDVCDLPLTGKLHAESHYMGKSHNKAVMGHKNPTGQGFYKDGKWVRIAKKKSEAFDFEKGEDNFGRDFKPNFKQSDPDGPPPAKKIKETTTPSKFWCEVCSVTATCQEQLESHFRGQKHLKKLKLAGSVKNTEQIEPIVSAGSSSSQIGACPLINLEQNLSVYRTPSGDYYCPSCNATSNSETQFLQHMKSKAHAKKAAAKKTA